MRRILLMLPVLALVACQTDTPTAVDESIRLNSAPEGLRVILEDGSVNTQYDVLWFHVKNPGYWMPPCDASPYSWWHVEGYANEPRNTVPEYFGIAFEGVTVFQCLSTSWWPDVTHDGIPDFAFKVDGYTVCDALDDYSAKNIRVSGQLTSLVSGDVVEFEETFVIRCPFLN